MKKIFVGYTQYQLLNFLLLNNILEKNMLIVLSSNLFNLKEKLYDKCEVKFFLLDKPLLKNFIEFIKYYRELNFFVKEVNVKREDFVYGDSTVMYFDSENTYLLEDGIGNYVTKAHKKTLSLKGKVYLFIENIIHFFIFRKKKYSIEDIFNKVKYFYITGIAPKNYELYNKKVKRINLKLLWDNKVEEEKKMILSIFGMDRIELDNLQGRKILLFTQPLSEDGIISEEEKIELYRKILKNYSRKEVIVKSHPREKTDYLKYFKECYVLKGNFPSELLYLEGINIYKVVTIFSTAALSFGNNVKIDFYGTEVNSKLFEKFGNCDVVMKRTAWLEND